MNFFKNEIVFGEYGREGKECLTVWVGCKLLISKDAVSSSDEGSFGGIGSA